MSRKYLQCLQNIYNVELYYLHQFLYKPEKLKFIVYLAPFYIIRLLSLSTRENFFYLFPISPPRSMSFLSVASSAFFAEINVVKIKNAIWRANSALVWWSYNTTLLHVMSIKYIKWRWVLGKRSLVQISKEF